jgi:hypothetical protein
VDKRGAHVAWEAAQIDPAKRGCEMGRLLRVVSLPGQDVTPVQPLAEWDQVYLSAASSTCPTARTPAELLTALAAAKTEVPLCGRAVLSASQVKTRDVLAMFDAAKTALPLLRWGLSMTAPYAPNAPCGLE